MVYIYSYIATREINYEIKETLLVKEYRNVYT